MRLLLVEDDARIARFVAKGLREQAYAVDVAVNGDDALYEAAISFLRSRHSGRDDSRPKRI